MFKFLKDMLKPGKEEASLTLGIDEVAPFLETSLQDVTASGIGRAPKCTASSSAWKVSSVVQTRLAMRASGTVVS